MLAHGVHLDEAELCRCHESGTALAHCPTSNLFLGCGLFRIARREAIRAARSRSGSAPTSAAAPASRCSPPWARPTRSRSSAGARSTPIEAFYLATLGGARALALDDRIGTLAPGREADLVVLDPNATPLLAFRNRRARSIDETFAVLTTLGDDRAVRATYVAGKLAHTRASVDP